MQRRTTLIVEPLEARTLLAVDALGLLVSQAPQSSYSFNGTGNNVANPGWGSAGSDLLRLAPADYGDGISTPAGSDRPGAREISNTVVDQGDEDIISDRMLAAMVYAWGQFIDHDLDLTPNANPAESFPVKIPTGDDQFDPDDTGTQTIPLNRSAFDPATDKVDPVTGDVIPREQVNTITAFLDGSMIYGSDAKTATALRTLTGGKLKTGAGNLLPFNDAATFPNGTLQMANDAHRVPDNQLFATGDARGNENVELTSLQTLFVREHNYWAGRIAASNRSLTDEQIFQKARSIVIAEIQSITYNQWLPDVLGRRAMDAYAGYDSTVNPGISNEFSTAAFRFGHSLLGNDVEFLDNQGDEVGEEIPLSEAFFNPPVVSEFGIDPILKYLASDPSSELDNHIVGSVRNFLFGPPGAGGLDLASLNIQRGRDHGLADYNTVRASVGLPRVTGFAGITSDTDLQSDLQQLYGSVDNVDLWVGALAEDHVPGASVGPTLKAIISDQFERLRDGDRFWYQNTFSGRALSQIENTTLTDVIRRNTDLSNLQQDVFFFRANIAGTVFVDTDRDGRIDRNERSLGGVTVELVEPDSGEVLATTKTNGRGQYQFDVLDGIRTGEYEIRVVPGNGDHFNGVSKTAVITRGGQLLAALNLLVTPVRRTAPIASPATTPSASSALSAPVADTAGDTAEARATVTLLATSPAAVDAAMGGSGGIDATRAVRRRR